MADIHIRKIDEQMYSALRARAKRHGVSVEEEVRHILRSAVSAPDKLGDLAVEIFGTHGIEIDIPHPVLTWDDHLATAVTAEGRSAEETVYADRDERW